MFKFLQAKPKTFRDIILSHIKLGTLKNYVKDRPEVYKQLLTTLHETGNDFLHQAVIANQPVILQWLLEKHPDGIRQKARVNAPTALTADVETLAIICNNKCKEVTQAHLDEMEKQDQRESCEALGGKSWHAYQQKK